MTTPKFYVCVYCRKKAKDGHYCNEAEKFEKVNPDMFVCCRPCERCGEPIRITKIMPPSELDTFTHPCGMKIRFRRAGNAGNI